MLVLSRKLGEKVCLITPDGTYLWVTVVDIDRGKIRLGFNAPAEVKIFRQELLPIEERGSNGTEGGTDSGKGLRDSGNVGDAGPP